MIAIINRIMIFQDVDMLKRARPRYALPFAWAVRHDGVALWDMLYQRRLALQGGRPRDLTPGVPGGLPGGMVALGVRSHAGGSDGDRGGIGSGGEDAYDPF